MIPRLLGPVQHGLLVPRGGRPVGPWVPPPDTLTLQQRIDAASASSTLDLGGNVYSVGATVDKALTIVGGTIDVAAGQKGLTITASDVTVNGMTITGPQFSNYVDAEAGIYTNATSGAPLSGLTITGCTITGFGGYGIRTRFTNSVTITGNTITDIVYAGVMALSMDNGLVDGNTIRRIGEVNDPDLGYNAYGIVFSQNASEARSEDCVASNNLVEYVPSWHAFDTHGGIRITFTDNEVNYCRKAFYITTGDATTPEDITITDNVMNNPYSPVVADVTAIWYTQATNITITGNSGHGWGSGRDIDDWGPGSTGETISGNTFTN